MNRTKLKNYAPQARRDFIQAMMDRASYFGLTDTKSEPVVVKGDVAVIGGRSFPIAVAKKRKALEDRIKRHGPDWSKGFAQTMEAMAYTWFNRLVAIRFMELHGYLEHGYRVLSHPEGKPTPEILEHAEHVELPGLKKEAVIDLKLAGNKEGELYRLLLTAQCNALHTAMPFLFEKIDDETELLLPDNLLNSDSLMRKLVGEIEEEDWNEVEIIGWLYQFYISEKKDEVIGKVVASEDIPAATQLFTPNWIVKYLVQNTLGRQWLATYPQSALRQQMEYYIEPAEQTPEVREQLKAITPTSLNPEELTLLDPACGSGHILVEAYDLFKAIYQERGYRAKDIPALILQKNLFGMEIDDRAAQLAAFALMMKARADDRRIFDSEAKPNILAFENSQGMKASEIHFALTSPLKGEKEGELESPAPDGHLFEPDDNLFTRAEAAKAAASRTPTSVNFSQADVASLLELFENAKTFGSLIQVPPKLAAKLPEIEKRLDAVLRHGDLTHASTYVIAPLLQQAALLVRQYDCVCANPPYMGRKYQCDDIEGILVTDYADYCCDLYAAFIYRCITLCRRSGIVAMITMDSWMFGDDFSNARRDILFRTSIIANAHLGPRAFDEISGEVVQTCAFALYPTSCPELIGAYFRLIKPKTSDGKRTLLIAGSTRFDVTTASFQSFPRNCMAYFATPETRDVFVHGRNLADFVEAFTGLQTGDNPGFIRAWSEVSIAHIQFGATPESAKKSRCRWFPYVKGSEYRKWYGNLSFVVNWENDGAAIRSHRSATVRNSAYYFAPGLAYNNIAKHFSARLVDGGAIFDQKNSMFIAKDAKYLLGTLGFLHAKVIAPLLEVVAPKDFNPGSLKAIPVDPAILQHPTLTSNVHKLVAIARKDWDSFEASWHFEANPLMGKEIHTSLLATTWEALRHSCECDWQKTKALEEQNNRLLLDAYGLSQDVSAEIGGEHITLYRPERAEDIKRLLSYAIGCMLGRYSLDKPGLIYAHSGNQGFDSSQYNTFRADDDGIIPLLETDWGIGDDVTNRFVEFIGMAWPKDHLEENLKFVADSLGLTGSEQPRDTIRRYLATVFYKHHLSMYKRRPIYWLFSSGKQRAFQCLVYLHRYQEGTLARMRTEYVIPLQGQIAARIEQLEVDKTKATSTSHRNKLQKEQTDLKKQQAELLVFEEKLKHAADQKISLDLDDGVKVNYAKFGDLLAESKAITGGKEEE
jgi:hypothetical protein